MSGRWVFRTILVLIAVFLAPHLALACNFDDICDEGENLAFCEDCTGAACGDGTCDAGLGENVTDSGGYCPEDCGKADDEPCESPGECAGGFCNCDFCASSRATDFCCSNSDCGSVSCGDWTLFCEGGDSRQQRTCSDFICMNQQCQDWEYEEDVLVQTCFQGCDETSGQCNTCTPNAVHRQFKPPFSRIGQVFEAGLVRTGAVPLRFAGRISSSWH